MVIIMKRLSIYEKWDEAEDVEFVFAKVKSGEWDFARFEAWRDHLVCAEIRDHDMGDSY